VVDYIEDNTLAFWSSIMAYREWHDGRRDGARVGEVRSQLRSRVGIGWDTGCGCLWSRVGTAS